MGEMPKLGLTRSTLIILITPSPLAVSEHRFGAKSVKSSFQQCLILKSAQIIILLRF